MLKKMMAFLLMAVLVTNISLPNINAAENFPAEKFPYQEMQVQVMPEFDYPENWPKDKPALLIGYFGTFVNKSGAKYDGEISFPLPVDEPDFEVYLAAEFPKENQPEVQVDYRIDKEQKMIYWKPTKPIEKDAIYKYVIEYYSNPIDVQDQKSFRYSFNSPADMEQLDIVVYAPINAKDFKMEPKATSETNSEYGEEIHYYQLKNIKKGADLAYKATYIKKDHTSSMSVIKTQQPPIDENHQGVTATEQVLKNSSGSKNTNNRPIIDTTGAIIIGISLIIMGVFIFFGFKGKGTAPTPKGRNTQPIVRTSKINNKQDPKLEDKKQLRKMLLSGEIDQQTYDEKIKKLG
ncbi:hypothetical protein [Pseudoneobacillus sp. C159]